MKQYGIYTSDGKLVTTVEGEGLRCTDTATIIEKEGDFAAVVPSESGCFVALRQ